jgi:nitrous oxidase accessory protein NosD
LLVVSLKLASRLAPLAVVCAVAVLAAAGGADARRAAVACGDTITADLTLTADLTGCSGDGLIVAADGVRLDLNGHVVSGLGAGTGITVSAADVSVVNGFVRGFGTGVRSIGSVGGTQLAGLGVTANGTGILAFAPSGMVVGSAIAGNAGNGLTGRGSGWTIRDSVISDNAGTGLSFFFAGNATIERNVVRRNTGSGIEFLAHVDQSAITDNLVTQNGAFGIRVLDSTTQVLRNDVRKNGATGIRLSEGENPAAVIFYVVTGNSSNDNAGNGIDATAGMTDGGGNSAKKNDATPQCVNIVCSKN